jgi:adenosylhomocysteine nucleosidase
MKVGIIGAMADEVAALKTQAGAVCALERASMSFCAGRLGSTEVVIVQSGMGKVNAGICAQILMDEFAVTHIINTGVAGSLCRDIDIGDIVVSTDAVQHDYDVSPIGFRRGEIPYTGLAAFPADSALCALAVRAARTVAPEIRVFEGRVCSGDQFISDSAKKDAITAAFGGLCAEMEGAAVAQVCHLNGLPFVIIRAVSDKADGEGGVSFETFMAEAAQRSAAIVAHMLRQF